MWMGATKVHSSKPMTNSRFSTAFASDGSVLVVGAAGADSQLGIAHIFERGEMNKWEEKSVVFKEEEGMEPVVGAKIDCENDTASFVRL